MTNPLEKVRQHMKSVKTPTLSSLVYKDECMFSYDTPFSAGGLAVSLSSWQGFGEQFVQLDHEKTGNALYLVSKFKKVPKTPEQIAEEEAKSATDTEAAAAAGSLLIGGADDTPVVKEYTLLLMPEKLVVPFPNQELPTVVEQACEAIIAHSGVALKDSTAAFVEDFVAKESKYARTLEQLPSDGKKIPADPKLWKCDETGVTENLWLNLGTGHIGSGRQHWDGSGGNGAAERQFETTGSKYPLVVKLGTITPTSADIFSYAKDENDMVLDPLLAQHLSHWGIDIMQQEKTEKTMAELQVSLNMEYDWSKITEGKEDLVALNGPGYVGIANLGNSCYLNSVVQTLFSTAQVKERYFDVAANIFKTAPQDPASDFATQMAKLGEGLLGDRYAAGAAGDDGEGPAASSDVCVRPLGFRSLVGQGHPEFSSARQQDASEYFTHLLDTMSRAERAAGDRLGGAAGVATSHYFNATVETRIECGESKQVRYKSTKMPVIGLQIPMEAADNKPEVEAYQAAKRAKTEADPAADAAAAAAAATAAASDAAVVPRVSLQACLDRYFGDEILPDYYSSATGKNGVAKKTIKISTFPSYLVLQLNRYYFSETWEPTKKDVEVPMPEELDLEGYRGKGLQEAEVELKEGAAPPAGGAGDSGAAAAAAPAADEIDMAVVQQLMTMGFTENACKRATKAVSGAGVEAASNWMFGHMEDPDFNDPLPAPAAAATAAAGAGGGGKPAISEDAIQMLCGIGGFAPRQAEAGLIACDGNSERAADWLFSRMDDLDTAVEAVYAAQAGDAAAAAAGGGGGAGDGGGSGDADDGEGKYELFGIISHLGKNTGSGHYVAHIKKEGKWAIFNDRKVGESKAPPLDVGYLYVYKRTA